MLFFMKSQVNNCIRFQCHFTPAPVTVLGVGIYIYLPLFYTTSINSYVEYSHYNSQHFMFQYPPGGISDYIMNTRPLYMRLLYYI